MMNIQCNKTAFFLPIPFLVILNSWLSLCNANENVRDGDPYYYMRLAKEFPHIWDTTFPVLYPLAIKSVNIFCGNYFIASKVLCVLAILFIFAYTYIKNFFWKEMWVIFSTVSFLETNFWTRSETILVPLLLIFSHISYRYLTEVPGKNRKWSLKFVVILMLLCLTKYSCIFIVAAIYAYLAVYFIAKKKILYPLLTACIITTIFVTLYLTYNYYLTGYPTGPRITTWNNKELLNIRLSLFSISYCLNPVVNSRLIFGYKINYIVLFAVSVALYIPLAIHLIRKKLILNHINLYYLNIGIIFLIFTVVSYVTIKLDHLNARLLLPFIFFLYFFIAILIRKKRNMVMISYISLTVCILNNIYIYTHGQTI